MTNKTVYPEWVQNYRTQGTIVKKIGNTYYQKMPILSAHRIGGVRKDI